MDIIKFRALIMPANKFAFHGKGITLKEISKLGDSYFKEDVLWLQYSGFNDKNDKEIYRGDTVGSIFIDGKEYTNSPIVFIDGTFCIHIKGGISDKHDYIPCLYEADHRYIEVAGNIWKAK